MPSTYTPNQKFEKPARGEQAGVWDTPINRNFDKIDAKITAETSINIASGDGTLATSQSAVANADAITISLHGNFTAARRLNLPSTTSHPYWIDVQSSVSAFPVSIGVTGGAGVEVEISAATPKTLLIWSDGTDTKVISEGPKAGYNRPFIGEIRMFRGVSADIPAGWFKCDGNNSTVDFGGRFPVGVSIDTSVGTTQTAAQKTTSTTSLGSLTITGSTAAVSLTRSHIPEHYHLMFLNKNPLAPGDAFVDLTSSNFAVESWAGLTSEYSYFIGGDTSVANVGRTEYGNDGGLGGNEGDPHSHDAGNLVVSAGGHTHTFTLDETNIPRVKVYFIEYRGE